MKLFRTTVLLTLAVVSVAQEPDDMRARLLAFHKPYDKFLRSFIGCPAITPEKMKADSMELVECEASLSVMDFKSFERAREAAKKLFDLAEPKGQHADAQPKP